jgi:hypothetical protein
VLLKHFLPKKYVAKTLFAEKAFAEAKHNL